MIAFGFTRRFTGRRGLWEFSRLAFSWNASDQNVAARPIVIGSVVNTVSKKMCGRIGASSWARVQLTSQGPVILGGEVTCHGLLNFIYCSRVL